MKSATETNEVAYKGLEVKLARCKSDLQTSQLQYEELSSEYEKYKVRAHNVLKQQKASQQEVDSSRFEQEKYAIFTLGVFLVFMYFCYLRTLILILVANSRGGFAYSFSWKV